MQSSPSVCRWHKTGKSGWYGRGPFCHPEGSWRNDLRRTSSRSVKGSANSCNWTPSWMWASNVPLSQKKKKKNKLMLSWHVLDKAFSAGQERWSSLFSTGVQQSAMRMMTGQEHLCPEERLREWERLFLHEEEKAWGTSNFQGVPEGGNYRRWSHAFWWVPSVRTAGSRQILKHRRPLLNIQKFLIWEWLNTGTGCPQQLCIFHPWRYPNLDMVLDDHL